MSNPTGYLIPEDYVDSFFAACDRERSNNRGHSKIEPQEEQLAPRSFSSESVMLLEDLGADRVGWAEKLRIDTESYILDVAVLGWPPASVEDIQIRVANIGQPFGNFIVPLNATAEEFADITGVTGEVTLGAQTVTKENGDEVLLVPSRWRVRWDSEEVAQQISPGPAGQAHIVRVERTLLYGTGNQLKVIQTLPTGWDTPLRSGAICETVRGTGSLYKVIGAEARFWYGTSITSEVP